MRAFVIRLLWNGLPVAVLLAALGYGMAQMAEMMQGQADRPSPAGVPELTDHLQWRVPLGLAAWGFGLVLAFELLLSLWRKPVPADGKGSEAKKSIAAIQDEAEQLLLKLLAEADAAERARSLPSPADPTPPPRGAVAPVPAETHVEARV